METEKGLCSICHINQYKYTCPACKTNTCSIACVRRHKQQTECTGLVDQTKFVPRNQFSEDSTHLNRDYNFLLNVDRSIQLGKSDVKSQARNVFKHGLGNSQHHSGNKRFKPNNTEDARLKTVNAVFPHQPSTFVKRENTLVIQLPAGMSRAMSNKTGYDKKAKAFIWTVEWVFLGDGAKEMSRFLSYRLKEHLILKEAVPMNIVSGLGQSDVEKLSFHLENVLSRNKAQLSLIPLDHTLSISQVLKDKVVLEYPTIYISSEDMKDYEIDQNEAYGIAEESSVESDTDSSSDSDSSDDSDSAPEESSSKEVAKATEAEAEAEAEPEAVTAADSRPHEGEPEAVTADLHPNELDNVD